MDRLWSEAVIALVALLVTAPASEPSGGFDFDLLGPSQAASAPFVADLDDQIKARRLMLNVHQGAGFALTALMVATVVVGQLSYSDRFGGGPSTARYELAHKVIAYSTFGLFVGTGALAIFAPTPLKEDRGFDRMTLHKVGMYGAAAGMVLQIVLGIVTRQQEGFVAQRNLAISHLAIGYASLAFMATGVGAIVF